MNFSNQFMNIDHQKQTQFQIPQMHQQGVTHSTSTSTVTCQNYIPSSEMMQSLQFPSKLIKTSLYISSSKLPQQMKANLLHNLVFNKTNIPTFPFNQQLQSPSNSQTRNSTNQSVCPRTLFKKEEDEKIKKLVKIFGTRHWDLVAQFMEGRTAKQCRDRYSNYLIPGFFQGEWSEEEDSLLIKLYNENGPRWSVIQKSFHNRSANNIKNRWYYFLRKKYLNKQEKIENENKQSLVLNEKEIKNNDFDDVKEIIDDDENDKNIEFYENEPVFFQRENDEIFEIFNNNAENDNWVFI